MKALLLDTHVVVAFVGGRSSLGPQTRRLIGAMLARQAVWFCAVSIWEMALLIESGKLRLGVELDQWRTAALGLGLAELPLFGSSILRGTQVIPDHSDMFDRMIVGSALMEHAVLVTADSVILAWKGALLRQDAAK